MGQVSKLAAAAPLALLKIDLGVVPQGGCRDFAFLLKNPTDTAVEIRKIESSCDCLHVRVPKGVVPAKGKAVATIQLDLSDDKQTPGDLGVEVKGYTPKKEIAFALTVDVSILPKEEFAP